MRNRSQHIRERKQGMSDKKIEKARRKALRKRLAMVLCRMDGRDPFERYPAAVLYGRKTILKERWELYGKEAATRLERMNWQLEDEKT